MQERALAARAARALRAAIADPSTMGAAQSLHIDYSRPRRAEWITSWASLPGFSRRTGRHVLYHRLSLAGWEFSKSIRVHSVANIGTNNQMLVCKVVRVNVDRKASGLIGFYSPDVELQRRSVRDALEIDIRSAGDNVRDHPLFFNAWMLCKDLVHVLPSQCRSVFDWWLNGLPWENGCAESRVVRTSLLAALIGFSRKVRCRWPCLSLHVNCSSWQLPCIGQLKAQRDVQAIWHQREMRSGLVKVKRDPRSRLKPRCGQLICRDVGLSQSKKSEQNRADRGEQGAKRNDAILGRSIIQDRGAPTSQRGNLVLLQAHACHRNRTRSATNITRSAHARKRRRDDRVIITAEPQQRRFVGDPIVSSEADHVEHDLRADQRQRGRPTSTQTSEADFCNSTSSSSGVTRACDTSSRMEAGPKPTLNLMAAE